MQNTEGAADNEEIDKLIKSINQGMTESSPRESAQPQIITNLQNSLNYKKLPISDKKMQRYKDEASASVSQRQTLATMKLSNIDRGFLSTQATNNGGAEVMTMRGPTPVQLKEQKLSDGRKTENLEKVRPTQVVIGKKTAD